MKKDWANAPAGYETSDAPRAIEIQRMIEQERNPKPAQVMTKDKAADEKPAADAASDSGQVKDEKAAEEAAEPANDDEVDATDP